jgi:hypothetical protein
MMSPATKYGTEVRINDAPLTGGKLTATLVHSQNFETGTLIRRKLVCLEF